MASATCSKLRRHGGTDASTQPAANCVDASVPPCSPDDQRRWLLVPHGGQLLAIGHERAALVEARAIEPEYLVVGAALQRTLRRLVGIFASPDADAVEPDEDGAVGIGEIDRDAAAVAIDVALKVDAGCRRGPGIHIAHAWCMTAIAA